MFYTLKHANVGDTSYSFETTAPPFSKKREGRLAKVACTNCRISKLKCSGDTQGCQRCLNKKIKCQYPSSTRSLTHKKASSQAKTRHSRPGSITTAAATTATTTTTTTIATSSSSSSSPSYSYSSVSSSASPFSEDDFPSVTSSQEAPFGNSSRELGFPFDGVDFITPDSINALLPGELTDMGQLDAMLSWDHQPFSFTPDTCKAPWNDMPELTDIDFISNSSNPNSSPVSPLPMSDTSCSCFVQAVSIHEAVLLARLGLDEQSAVAVDILERLNKALLESKKLLECPKCSTQPSYIMLLLSMCSETLASLEDISVGTSRGVMNGSTVSASISDSTEHQGIALGGVMGGEDHLRRYGIAMDDGDERLVLQSLIRARAARLERLISMLNGILDSNNWPSHSGFMRKLQARLMKLSFGSSMIVSPT